MPLTEVTDLETFWRQRSTCWLISGPPNSGKTGSLPTFLEGEKERIAYVAYPGEEGAGTFPAKDLGDRAKIWVGSDLSDPSKPIDWASELRSVKQVTTDILAGKYGQFDVFAGDGLHKLHSLFLAVATGGESMKSYDFDAKCYGEAWKGFIQYLRLCFRSPLVRKKVWTIWDGREKDDPDAKDKDTQKHIFPELPGKGAKEIMGEFGVVVYATVKGVAEGARYEWQTKPFGKVWGCGIKAPVPVTKGVTTFVAQDYKVLAKALGLVK